MGLRRNRPYNQAAQRALSRVKHLQEEIQEYYWDFTVTSDLLELRNLATVAELIVQSALTARKPRPAAALDFPNRSSPLPNETPSLPAIIKKVNVGQASRNNRKLGLNPPAGCVTLQPFRKKPG